LEAANSFSEAPRKPVKITWQALEKPPCISHPALKQLFSVPIQLKNITERGYMESENSEKEINLKCHDTVRYP
jgi:hypothetical protein